MSEYNIQRALEITETLNNKFRTHPELNLFIIDIYPRHYTTYAELNNGQVYRAAHEYTESLDHVAHTIQRQITMMNGLDERTRN